jgi:hypothetical protein
LNAGRALAIFGMGRKKFFRSAGCQRPEKKSFFAPLSVGGLKKKFFRFAECQWPEKKFFRRRRCFGKAAEI